MKNILLMALALCCIWAAFSVGVFVHNDITANYARKADRAEENTEACQREVAICREEVRRLVQVKP